MSSFSYIVLDWNTPSKNWFSERRCPNVRVFDASGATVLDSEVVHGDDGVEAFLASRGYAGAAHDAAAESAHRDAELQARIQRDREQGPPRHPYQ